MATTVLCSTIGPSAPSCLFHVRIAHPFQDGDERLMQCDRPLSAIVPGFTVRLAHSLQDGDDRLMQHDRPLSAIVSLSRPDRASLPGWRRTSYAVRSAPQRHRTWLHGSARTFPSGWRRPSYAARSAPQRHRVSFTFGSRIPSRMAIDRLMQHDWPLGGIMSSPPSAPPMPSRMGDPSYAARLLLGADMPVLSMRATASITSCIPSLVHYIHTLHAYIHSCIIPHTFIHTHVHHVLIVPRRRVIDDGPLSFSDWKARVRVLYSRLMHSGGVCPWRSTLRPTLSGRGVPHW
ncbi:unnamed protein product [Cuscuta epithymum]|uniref:Uncharacterized protein n=1 Tax=Cuscuta epithymum TaxID=186058 RepID=A0AAV0G0X9_9ASTE|nr:unnamed protein product [Cuscuta epithymum]